MYDLTMTLPDARMLQSWTYPTRTVFLTVQTVFSPINPPSTVRSPPHSIIAPFSTQPRTVMSPPHRIINPESTLPSTTMAPEKRIFPVSGPTSPWILNSGMTSTPSGSRTAMPSIVLVYRTTSSFASFSTFLPALNFRSSTSPTSMIVPSASTPARPFFAKYNSAITSPFRTS